MIFLSHCILHFYSTVQQRKGINPQVQQGGLGAQVTPTCKKYTRNYKGECLTRFNLCFEHGRLDNYVKDCRSGNGAGESNLKSELLIKVGKLNMIVLNAIIDLCTLS